MAGAVDKKYTFKVAKNANKIEIKKAVSELSLIHISEPTRH